MQNKLICNSCGSNKIINEVKIVDFGHGNEKKNLSVEIKKSDFMFFNKYDKGPLHAKICCSCGKVDLSIKNGQELWEAYLKNKNTI
ncbi:MAG: hypothetical protein KJO22_00135 [Bacteroidia bacterium]|nr:hypothetical protein [Bacteroidia bacterium]